MSEEITKMIALIIAMMFALTMLPVIVGQFEFIGAGNQTQITREPFRFPNIEIENPIHRGIVNNIWTGILLMILAFVSAGCVYGIRFLYNQIRTGKIEDE